MAENRKREIHKSLVTTENYDLAFTWWERVASKILVLKESSTSVLIVRHENWGETEMMAKTYLLANYQQVTKDGVIPIRKTNQ